MLPETYAVAGVDQETRSFPECWVQQRNKGHQLSITRTVPFTVVSLFYTIHHPTWGAISKSLDIASRLKHLSVVLDKASVQAPEAPLGIMSLSQSRCSDKDHLTSPIHDVDDGNKQYPHPMDPFDSGELLMIGLSLTAFVILASVAVYVTVSKLQL